MAYVFKIKIKNITRPPVWRRVSVPENFTFTQFHLVIQAAFGWTNSHLFKFSDEEYRPNFIIYPQLEDDDYYTCIRIDSEKTPLEQYFKEHDKLLYIYDFGDYWTHEITLEDGNYDGGGTALCLAGKGACPPEDIGGYGGYECMKQAFATHPYGREANSYREWLGMGKRKTWDAKAFSIEESNDLLRYVQTLSPIFTKEGGNEGIG